MPEKNERYCKLGLKILAMLPSYFDYSFVHLSTSQAQIKPEIIVNFRPESGPNPNPKSQAELTSLLRVMKGF